MVKKGKKGQKKLKKWYPANVISRIIRHAVYYEYSPYTAEIWNV